MSGKRKGWIQWILIFVSILVLLVGMKNSILAINHEQKVLENFRFVDEMDGEELFCVEFQPRFDGYRGDPFGTKIIFWSDGYNMFVLETRLTTDEELVREIIRSVQKVEDITDYAKYKEIPDYE